MRNFRLKAGIITLIATLGIVAGSFVLARTPGESYSNSNVLSGNNPNLEIAKIAKRHAEYTMMLKGLGVRTDLLFTPFIAYLQTGEFPENTQEIFSDPDWMFTDQNRQDIEKLLDSGDVMGAAVLTANIVFATEKEKGSMKQIYPDLWQTTPQKQFSTLNAYAYLLKTENGNVLFYNPRSSEDFQQITDLGGITDQYLSHCHEVDDSLISVKKTFNSKLCCHVKVERYFNEKISADTYFNPSRSEFHSDNIEVINTPGHTDNSLCFRYCSPHGKNYLFTGDTIYLDNGVWKTVVVEGDGGNRRDLDNSLSLLRNLSVDVIICSVSIGEMEVVEVTPSEWQTIIDNLLNH